jgi:alpha-beta hydrolase superfamily lysophospholipase
MNASKKDCQYLTTSKKQQVYIENNFFSISSPSSKLLAIHGLGTSSAWFQRLSSDLCEDKIATFIPDLPGFGKSGDRGSINSFKDWIEATQLSWQKLNEDDSKNSFILGHSLGGIIALETLTKLSPKPKGIILTVPALVANTKLWSPTEFMLPTFIKAILEPNEKITYPFPKEIFEAIKKGEVSLEQLTPEVKPTVFLEILMLSLKSWFSASKMSEIPLLMILSENDPSCSPEAAKQFFKLCSSTDKTLKVFEGGGHDLYLLSCYEELKDTISTWINQKSS